ncbi:hypothetical protein RHECNPAF_890054 [Rhizobium etli CNPAF512]|nr:hypothetical protein RHECNPAF_890054 [Rhizobium etli CNPAF512]
MQDAGEEIIRVAVVIHVRFSTCESLSPRRARFLLWRETRCAPFPYI